MRYLVTILSLFISLSAVAQLLPIRVTVTEKDTRQPVFFAYVNIYAPNGGLVNTYETDEMGVATFSPEKYPCTIEVVAAGYERYSREYNNPPVNPNMDIRLVKKFASMNEVVVTGLAEPEKLKNALSNYQVISKATIQAQGAVTLNDVLKNQLNMRIDNDNVLGSSLNMQGMAGNKVKILIDGIPLNGREGGNINLGQINLNNVERIEVVQGPMSVVYGTDAIGGIINVITKKDNRPLGINMNAYYETVGKYNIDGALTFKVLSRSQFTIGGGRNYFGGYKYIDQNASYNGITPDVKRSQYFKPTEQYIGNFAYSYRSAKSFRLHLATDYLDERVTNKGSVSGFDPFNAFAYDEYYTTKRYTNRLSLEGKLGANGRWQSQNSYFIYDRTRARLKKDLVTMSELPTVAQGDQDTSTFKNVYLRSSYSNKAWKLNYTAGYDFNLEFAHSLKLNGLTKSIQDYAVYANVSTPIVKDKLVAQIGGRTNYNNTYTAPPIIPSFNLLYTPISKLQIRASYTDGFRAPSLKEMHLSFIDNNHNLIGNPDLKAETSKHLQLSGSYQLYEEQADYLQFILTGYYNDVSDGIVLVNQRPDDVNSIDYKYDNLDRQQNMIGTLQVDGQIMDLHYQLGYSVNNTFAQQGYTSFVASEGTVTLQYGIKKIGLGINAFYKYTAPQPYLATAITGNIAYQGEQAALHFCDASVEKKLFDKRLQLIAGMKNILNQQVVQLSGGASGGGAHSGGTGGVSFLPRSFFTTLRLNID
jgi:outer membrane receptor for ferrienterochelin and colicins